MNSFLPDRAGLLLLIITALFLHLAGTSRAATVFVDPMQPTGGDHYESLAAAFAAYGQWRDGEGDTIRLRDTAPHVISNSLTLPNPSGWGLMIMNAAGDEPVIVCNAPGQDALLVRNGPVIFHGLSFVGSEGVDGSDAGMQFLSAIGIEPEGAAAVEVLIQHCLITASSGGNAPVLDYSLPPPATGQIMRAVRVVGAPATPPLNMRIKDCVIAFTDGDAGLSVDGPLATGSEISIEGTLLVNPTSAGIRLTGLTASNAFRVLSSAILMKDSPGSRALYFTASGGENAPAVEILDSILSEAQHGAINSSGYTGALTVERSTLYYPHNTDLIALEDSPPTGGPELVLRNSIFGESPDSALRLGPDDPAPAPGSIALADLAVVGGPGYRAVQHQTVKDAFDSLYGGTGPLQAAPQFVRTFIDARYAGLRRWDSSTNSLFDVANAADYTGKATGGEFLDGGGEQAGAPTFRLDQRFEDFSADPGWEARNSRSTSPACQTTTQNFGFRASSSFAGGSAGEIGGEIRRASTRASYAVALPSTLTFNDTITASGRFAVRRSLGSTGLLVGFFDSDTSFGWRTPNTLCWRLDGETGFYRVYFEYGTSQWRTGNYEIDRSTDPQVPDLLSGGTSHAWSLSYDPDGNGGGGSVTFLLDGGPAKPSAGTTINLAPGHKADGATLNRFGAFNHMIGGSAALEFYLDDLVVNGVSIDFGSDPNWIGDGNNTSFLNCEVRPRHNFGFDDAGQQAGGAAPGEMGGLVWRCEMNEPTTNGYYADVNIGALTLEDPLQVSGKLNFTRGSSDAAVLIGWFKKDLAGPQNTDATDRDLPTNFLGIMLEGPSRDGFYFRQAYSTRTKAQEAIQGIGPRIIPGGGAHDWSLVYDPAVGGGRITATIDGEEVIQNISSGHRAIGADFDSFGMVSFRNGGHFAEAFWDDLSYTVRVSEPPDEVQLPPPPPEPTPFPPVQSNAVEGWEGY